MKKILLLLALALMLVACNSDKEHQEKLEKYDMYGVINSILEDRQTIDVNTTIWSSKSGLIPGEIESGTGYNLIYTENTKVSFENGDQTALAEVHEHQHIGIYLTEDGEAQEIVILNQMD